jgi:hypothetical protein
MATWPGSLPAYPLRDSFQDTSSWGVISSDPETGPRITRPRFTATEQPRTAEFNLDETQKATLKAFVDSDLAGGALPFDASWEGSPQSYLLTSPPVYRSRGVKWRVRLELVVLP